MSSVLPKNTFYRRPLPQSCTALSSPQGRQQFESSMRNKGCKSFFVLTEQFTTQSEPAYCGISSLVMVLNALAVDPRRLWKGNWRWYHEELLNCCMDLEEIKLTGITLNVFACMARCQGLKVDKSYAQDVSIDDFRRAVEFACVESDNPDNMNSNPLLVVSYTRQVLKQTGTGHFSPLAAYDPSSDQVLILDTARFKYGAHWVPLPLIFEAMQPIDPDTGKSRGFVLLSYDNKDSASVLPISILLRSTKSHNPVRQQYKQFLSNLDYQVSWNQVLEFWCKGVEGLSYVWDMLEPQLFPTDKDAADAVDAVRILLQSLILSSLPSTQYNKCSPTTQYKKCSPTTQYNKCSPNPCRPNCNRVIPLAPEEAVYIAYLASLSTERREEIIYSVDDAICEHVSEEARQQLLVEAELVRYAIDVNDEMQEETERMMLRTIASGNEPN